MIELTHHFVVSAITGSSGNHLIPTCGTMTNSTVFRISSNDTYFYTDHMAVTQSNGIGRGCSDLNNCNNHGACDYCNSKCDCHDGYGSSRDMSYALNRDFSPDCSTKSCPVGISIGSVPHRINNAYINKNVSVSNYTEMHHPAECSNNGICNRVSGQCTCNPGFYGASCQKMRCQNSCSDRGVCQPMRRLSTNPLALPLSNSVRLYENVNMTSGRDTHDNTWDADFGHMCVCDSSWPVGLNVNETQQAEYFGPACQLRHCPTGDDPNTAIDETDCTG